MKIIIIGDGKVGFTLAEHLSKEDNDVVIIDKNSDALQKASDTLDVMCIKGNGLSTSILQSAGVEETELLIAATTNDEMNMVCCLTGKKLGAKHTVARIRDPEYANELLIIKKELGLDMVINPEQATAQEITRILLFPAAINVDTFSRGRVQLVGYKLEGEDPLCDKKIEDVSKKLLKNILIAAVERNEKVYIPKGDFLMKSGDKIYILGESIHVSAYFRQIGKYVPKIKNVMIIGGGRIAYYLASSIRDLGMRVKIIETDPDRCLELSESLPGVMIFHGDGTDQEVLESENMKEMDAFVTLTGRDEDNLLAALFAMKNGVPKVVAKINRINYTGVVQSLGIDSVVSPKAITANHIIRYVRALKNSSGSKIETLYKIVGDQAEAMEFYTNKNTKNLNTPFKDIKFNSGILIGAIVRKGKIIIPKGNDFFMAGDSVVAISTDSNYDDINDFFKV